MRFVAVWACRTWMVCLGLLLGAGLLLLSGRARAEVEQTDGEIIPQQPGVGCNNNVSICINGNEASEGGAGDIDAVETATISQETFSPLCELTFRVVTRGADFKNTFGWYEVKRDAAGHALAPQLGQLHVFLGCDDAAGVEKTLTIPKGVTEIGFFLANSELSCVATQPDPLGPTLSAQPSNLFFSERQFNSDEDGLIHLLVWQSRANPNAFYFGWEDQNGGGDNDFEDLLTYVTGIQCAGGGEPCKAEGKGVCGDGVMQCRDGALTCVPTQMSSDEACNGLDDDCDGDTDEGDDLCPAGEICVKGRCEPPCGTGEFRCQSGEVCVEGVCIEDACATMTCRSGSVCRDGKCVAPCDDVSCPHGATCRNGVCVDVCASITCDPGFVCEPRESSDGETLVGVCTSCDCRGCGAGQSCVQHACIDSQCKDQTCGAGTHCVAGTCVDGCANARCPKGEICAAGACVADPNAGSGGSGRGGSGSASGGSGIVLDPGVIDGPNSGGGRPASGAVADDDTTIHVAGCGCAIPGGRRSASPALALMGLLGALGAARRRRRG
jgi:hypothetical protein